MSSVPTFKGQPVDLAQARDLELVRRVQAGDLDAFGELYGQYLSVVLRAAESVTRSRRDAEAVASDVFSKMLDAMRSGGFVLKGPSLGAYLRRCAHNAAVDALERAERIVPNDRIEHEAGDLLAEEEADPVRSDWARLFRGFIRLSDRDRDLLLLNVVRRLPPRRIRSEVPAFSNVPANTIAQAVSRAKGRLLKNFLRQESEVPGADQPCPWDERVLMAVLGRLTVDARPSVEMHVRECVRCADLQRDLTLVEPHLRLAALPLLATLGTAQFHTRPIATAKTAAESAQEETSEDAGRGADDADEKEPDAEVDRVSEPHEDRHADAGPRRQRRTLVKALASAVVLLLVLGVGATGLRFVERWRDGAAVPRAASLDGAITFSLRWPLSVTEDRAVVTSKYRLPKHQVRVGESVTLAVTSVGYIPALCDPSPRTDLSPANHQFSAQFTPEGRGDPHVGLIRVAGREPPVRPDEVRVPSPQTGPSSDQTTGCSDLHLKREYTESFVVPDVSGFYWLAIPSTRVYSALYDDQPYPVETLAPRVEMSLPFLRVIRGGSTPDTLARSILKALLGVEALLSVSFVTLLWAGGRARLIASALILTCVAVVATQVKSEEAVLSPFLGIGLLILSLLLAPILRRRHA